MTLEKAQEHLFDDLQDWLRKDIVWCDQKVPSEVITTVKLTDEIINRLTLLKNVLFKRIGLFIYSQCDAERVY